jgi:hypothetical protein
MWLLGLCLLAIVGVLGLACVITPEAMALDEPTRPPLADPFRPSMPKRNGVRVRVLFASPSTDDVLLDCIACAEARLDPGSVLHPGTPFSVRARRSCSAAWADAMIDTVLTRWADSGDPVEMVVLDGPGGREVRLYDETTRVQLPIAA